MCWLLEKPVEKKRSYKTRDHNSRDYGGMMSAYLAQDWIRQVKGVQALGLGNGDSLSQNLKKRARATALLFLSAPE